MLGKDEVRQRMRKAACFSVSSAMLITYDGQGKSPFRLITAEL
jgi:hypothetical protein